MARCPRPGLARLNSSSMAKRRRQDSFRASWLTRNSSKGIGWLLVQIPPGERKSGIPHSVEMPAPVNGRIARASPIISPSLAVAVGRSIADISFHPRTVVMLEEKLMKKENGHSIGPRVHHALPAYNAARARSRRRARFLLQQARPQGGPPPHGREEQVHARVPGRR